VLIIDNSNFSLQRSCDFLGGSGFEIVGKGLDGESGINLSLDHLPDIIIVDNELPDMEGTDLMQILKGEGIECEFIIIIPAQQQLLADNFTRMGAKDYIVKPYTMELLLETVNNNSLNII
jgi:DNA-binding NarL/FixJ family response regulator